MAVPEKGSPLRRSWYLYDPDSQARVAAPGMRRSDHVELVFRDGTVLVQHLGPVAKAATSKKALLFRVDTETGRRERLRIPGDPPVRRSGQALRLAYRFGRFQITPGGRFVCEVFDGHRQMITSLASGRSVFTRPIFGNLVGTIDETTVIYYDEEGLARADLETGDAAAIRFTTRIER